MIETPPICNYEGSDYQTSFWEEGGRAYEDAAEAQALQRLLPQGDGKRLLELGAGAGRNTPRYKGYDQVTLVDYSRTQLLQARSRLGESPRHRFVAADIYHLPFAAGVFDAATMIRTLHHMAEPRQALEQTRRVLKSRAVFILEYANKQNIKAILRYALRRQGWNPFSPEPVEFAALNYDFHPSTVRAWLRLSGFALDRTLTVSHFRIDLFKKLLPLRLLVWMDGQASRTGGLWQLSPSVFTLNRAVGESLPAAPDAFFACPACAAPLADTPPELVCASCGRRYPVEDGIYDFRLTAD